MKKLCASLFGIAGIFALVAMVGPASAKPLRDGTMASATLSGAEEVPDPGDADGAGTATLTFNTDSGEICWDIKVSNITLPSVGTHIHEGAKGVAGPVVVPLTAPDANGVATGCATPDAALMTRIMQNSENFYVNVHTSDFPAGAVRGQIMMAAGGAAPAPGLAALPSTGMGSSMYFALAGFALLAVAIGISLSIGVRRRTNAR